MKLELHDAVELRLELPKIVSDCIYAETPDLSCENEDGSKCDGTKCTTLTNAVIRLVHRGDLDTTFSEIVIGLRNRDAYGPTKITVVDSDANVIHETKHGALDGE